MNKYSVLLVALSSLLTFQEEHNDDGIDLRLNSAHMEIRIKSHELLFNDLNKRFPENFVRSRENGDLVTELVVFEGEKIVNKGKKDEVFIERDFVGVARLFEQVLVEGENLSEMYGVDFLYGYRTFRYKRYGKVKRGLLFRMVPIPIRKNKPKVASGFGSNPFAGNGKNEKEADQTIGFRFSSKGKLTVKKISFYSINGVHSDFEEQLKTWSLFPRGKEDLNLAFYQKTMEYDNIEELVLSLNENSKLLGRVVVPSRMSSVEHISIWGILADRRVAKLYEMLAELEPDQASEIAERNFDLELARYDATAVGTDIMPLMSRHALEAQIFLCSEFCKTGKVIELMDSWETWHAERKDARSFQFKAGAGPEFLFTANIYTNLISKHNNWSIEQTNQWLGEQFSAAIPADEPLPSISENWLYASDWTPNKKDVIQFVPTFNATNPWFGRKRQEKALQILRNELLTIDE